MAKAETGRFHEDLVHMAVLAKALSHPVRLRILQILAEKNTCLCGEIVDLLPLAQSTVSQHLKALKRAGLVQGEIEGPGTCYCLDPAVVEYAGRAFARLFSTMDPGPNGKGEKRCPTRKASRHS